MVYIMIGILVNSIFILLQLKLTRVIKVIFM